MTSAAYKLGGYDERACAGCGRPFRPDYPGARVCSNTCRKTVERERARAERARLMGLGGGEHPPCLVCGADVPRGNRGVQRWLERQTCSRACYAELARRNSLSKPPAEALTCIEWNNVFAAHNLALPSRGVYLKLLPEENRTLGGVAG